MLGELGVGRGRYRDDDLIVRARTALVDGREVREPLGPAMNAALTRIIESAVAAGLGITQRISAPGASLDAAEVDWVADVTIGPHHVEGSLLLRDQGGFARIEGGIPLPYSPPAAQARELGRMIELRDTYFEVIDGQAASLDDTGWEAARQTLNARYDAYVGLYGPVNRYRSYDTGRTGEDGRPVIGRRWPPMGGFRSDPGLPVVRALEDFDDATQTAIKAPVFVRRVLSPRQPVTATERPEDALALCLDERGSVDVETIGQLLGCDPAEARVRLGTLVFDDPEGGSPVPAAVYHVTSSLDYYHSNAVGAFARPLVWLNDNQAAALSYLDRVSQPGAVLAPWLLSMSVPAFTDRQVFAGHPMWQPPGNVALDDTFFSALTSDPSGALRRSILLRSRARFVLADCGSPPSLARAIAPLARVVARFGCVTIYETGLAGGSS